MSAQPSELRAVAYAGPQDDYAASFPRDWMIRDLPATNDETYEVRICIDSSEVRIGIHASDTNPNIGLVDLNAIGARRLAAILLEAADIVGHLPSNNRVANTC